MFTHAQVVRSCLQIVKKSVGYRSNWSPVGAKRAVNRIEIDAVLRAIITRFSTLDYMPLMPLPVHASFPGRDSSDLDGDTLEEHLGDPMYSSVFLLAHCIPRLL